MVAEVEKLLKPKQKTAMRFVQSMREDINKVFNTIEQRLRHAMEITLEKTAQYAEQ